MMVTFVSQCEKKALARTRRVLDAFANRIGDNTWQTVITNDGLLTVQKMLRQNASKSTAVSCHWIRSRSRSQFLWVVGNKKKFNGEGYVAVNSTEKDLLNSSIENDWKYLPIIKAITGLAALFHDWGKASKLFQDKIDPNCAFSVKGDPIRHEWISSLLFNELVTSSGDTSDDRAWLQRISSGDFMGTILPDDAEKQEKKPLTGLPNGASLIVWLIVSHHRLPLPKEENIIARQNRAKTDSIQDLLKRVTQKWGYENRYDEAEFKAHVNLCFNFPNGTLVGGDSWQEQLKLWANSLLNNLHLLDSAMSDGSWRVIVHHARLCLMLGDHYYSSQPPTESKTWQTDVSLYANTHPNIGGGRSLKQRLDEHLVRVAKTAISTARLLPFFESEPLTAESSETLKPQTNTPKKFRWQDKAVREINKWRERTEENRCGHFIVNMASTGCGKTIANAKVMQALSENGKSLRYILALGLRTLTLQTGDEYRERVGLSEEELAVLIGSHAVAELHLSGKAVLLDDLEELGEESGSESIEDLSDFKEGGSQLDWQGILPEEELTTVLTSEKERQLLYAPVLVCTIDHIMPATETKRGGRYILPHLRLMSSDLVIDEIDDFSGADLIAIGRLVHLAGMLGRKVMISSATIPPDLALGFFNAYQAGWQIFAASRDLTKRVACTWIDEFYTEVTDIALNDVSYDIYREYHHKFTLKRISKLKHLPVKRKANIQRCPIDDLAKEQSKQQQYFSLIQQAIINNHQRHNIVDEETGVIVSFGVVRVANIKPCIELTSYLLEAEWTGQIEIRAMAYHSQQVLLLRHEQETHLDEVLKRKEGVGQQPNALKNEVIRGHLKNCKSRGCRSLIFILVATPVEEVGRDHDFDWAVVEPSSYRSMIQLPGRVRRHRDTPVEQPNITLLQYNWKGFLGNAKRVFERPGYETSKETTLITHDLCQLVNEEELLKRIDATPRIQKSDPFDYGKLEYHNSLADLEHYATAQTLGCFDNFKSIGPKQLQGYVGNYWWMTALPQQLNSFRQSSPTIKLSLTADNGKKLFKQRAKTGEWLAIEQEHNVKHKSLPMEMMSKLWLVRDYESSISKKKTVEFNDYQISLRYGEISFSDYGGGCEYEYNDQLGFSKK